MIQDLTEDAVMISPRLILVRSGASERQWQAKVEELFDKDGDFIEKIRYRTSQDGGTIAIPPVLQEQKERRRKEMKGDEEKMKQVIIRLRGEFIEVRHKEAKDMMRMIADEAEIEIFNEESEVINGGKEWKMLTDARYGWKGDILLKCTSVEQVLKLFKKVEGKAFDVGDSGKVSIEVLPHARLVIDARNKSAEQ